MRTFIIKFTEDELLRLRDCHAIRNDFDEALKSKLTKALNAKPKSEITPLSEIAQMILDQPDGIPKQKLWNMRIFRDTDEEGRKEILRELSEDFGIVEYKTRHQNGQKRGALPIVLIHRRKIWI